MAWPPFALGHGASLLQSDYVDWPQGISLMWNTSMLLPTTILSPVTAALNPVVSYNLLVTLAPALSAWAGYLLIRRFVRSRAAAFIGGLLYGFSPAIMAESLGHPILTLVAVPPLIFLVIDAVIRGTRPPLALGAVLGVLAAIQLLISEEVLAATALVGVLAIAIIALERRGDIRPHLPRLAAATGSGLIVFLVLAGYPLVVQFFGPLRPAGLLHPANLIVNDLLSFVVPTRNQWLSPAVATRISDRFIGGRLIEMTSYIGLPLLLGLAYVATRFWGSLIVRAATLTALVVALLSLGYTIHVASHTTRIPVLALALIFPVFQRWIPGRALLYLSAAAWFLLNYAPLLRQLLPSRLSLFLFLAAGLLLAVFLDDLLARRGRALALGALATGVALLPLVPALPFPTASATVPPFFSGSAVDVIPQGAVALVVPVAGLHHELPMLWQARARLRFRMPEGYAFTRGPEVDQVNVPPSFTRNLFWAVEAGQHGAQLAPGERDALLADLHRWQVSDIIVGPMANQETAVALLTDLLHGPPLTVGGVALWDGL